MSKFSIVKKITRQNIRTRLLIALVIFLIGVVLAIIQIPKTTRYFLANKNVFSTSCDNYREGKFYQGKLYYLYDCFGTNDDGGFYLAPAENDDGESYFLIVFIPNKYEEKANAIIDQTYEYMESGDDSVLTESINCRGFLDEVDSTTYRFCYEYMDYVGLPQSARDKVCSTEFVFYPVEKILLSETGAFILIILVIFGGAIATAVTAFTKGYLKPLKNRLAKENMTLKDLDEEFANPVFNVSNIYVSNDHVVQATGTPTILNIKDVIWMYPSISAVSSGSQAIFYSFFYTRNHECVKFSLQDATSAEVLCKSVLASQPRALYGFVPENQDMYYHHFNELVDQVYNKAEDAQEESVSEGSTAIPSEPQDAPAVEDNTPPAAGDILTPSSVSQKEEDQL
ncbi:MAG: DUF6709 family protein [Saccharofermentanaceae bacterium]|nr:DUF6709 family protein [Saccharofermentanaceae bacterium]